MKSYRLTFAWYAILALSLAITVVWIQNKDYSTEARASLEARRVHCDIGQIPLDCLAKNPNAPVRQPTNKGK